MVAHSAAIEFGWQGNDEMEPAEGDGWAELKDDGSLEREICLLNGDDIALIARRAKTSSPACQARNSIALREAPAIIPRGFLGA
ncbi:hypothetical protein V5279_29190 [Bradyrhizobium sp. 26S5]|uniref:hypothetical protein n=1 Tax=Bradyrhizobium sp. 26S5 TaxID=3139729 RepID=UPI0030D1A89A